MQGVVVSPLPDAVMAIAEAEVSAILLLTVSMYALTWVVPETLLIAVTICAARCEELLTAERAPMFVPLIDRLFVVPFISAVPRPLMTEPETVAEFTAPRPDSVAVGRPETPIVSVVLAPTWNVKVDVEPSSSFTPLNVVL